MRIIPIIKTDKMYAIVNVNANLKPTTNINQFNTYFNLFN